MYTIQQNNYPHQNKYCQKVFMTRPSVRPLQPNLFTGTVKSQNAKQLMSGELKTVVTYLKTIQISCSIYETILYIAWMET